tara:strand:- start:20439 stop:31691 length:11253 start_codon:yes stop_codon:yes gene_type:complete
MSTRVTPGGGALLKPFFNSSYGIEKIDVLHGGSGYATTDPPKITIEGTMTPSVEGVFYPVISGVGTIREIVIFTSGAGYYPVFSTTTGGQAFIERGVFGTQAGVHTTGVASVFSGDYNIIDDNVHFSAAPYGKTGPVGLKTGSTFSGRIFSRQLDPYNPKDKNVIFDDLSLEFTGIAGTQFTLTENLGIVTSAFNDVNSGADINNNPFVLINNVTQTPGADFEVVDENTNKLNFLSGIPRAGRIVKVGLQTGAGYYSLYPAAATVGVGTTGTLKSVTVTGSGEGYRYPPEVIVRSSEGSGAAITAHLGTNDGSTVGVTTAVYNHIVGIMTFTTNVAHGYTEGQRVRVTGCGLTFTPVSVARNIATFAYTYTSGIATVTATGGHYIGTGTNQSKYVKLSQISVTNSGVSTFVMREDGYPILPAGVGNTNVVNVNMGIGTEALQYVSGGLIQAGIDTHILDNVNRVGFDILPGVGTNTFQGFVGITTFAHQYVTGGTVRRMQAGLVTGFTITDPGSGYFTSKRVAFVDYDNTNGVTTITGYGKTIGITTTIANVFYTPTTGIATVQGTNVHGLAVGDVVRLAGIAFSTGIGNTTFPYGRKQWFAVKTIPSTIDFSVDIGISTLGVHTHHQSTGTWTQYEGHGVKTDDWVVASGIALTSYAYPSQRLSNVTYDNVTGLATITTRKAHNLAARDQVILSGIAMTCDYDPALGISSAVYTNSTGIMTVTTSANHGYKLGKEVIFSGLGFTCQYNATDNQYYPRFRDLIYDTAVAIAGTAATTITLDVGISPATEQYAHTFDSATSGALITGGNHLHTFKSAEENALLSGGNFTHKFVSALSGAVSITGGGTLTPVDASYDPTTGDMVITKINHGLSPATAHTISTATYTPSTGVMEVTVANHGFSDGDRVWFKDNSITLTCDMDNDGSLHSYPRLTDPIRNEWRTISGVTNNTFKVNVGASPLKSFTPTDATYDPVTGYMTLTIGGHNLTAGTSVKLSANSIIFTCNEDQHITLHSYPRAMGPYGPDPAYNNAVGIVSTTGTTITLDVGKSSDTTEHIFKGTNAGYTATDAQYNAVAGIMTVGVLQHNLGIGDYVKFAADTFTFKCEMDGLTSNKTYPRISDPVSDKWTRVIGVSSNTFEVNVGTSATVGHNVAHADYNPNTGIMMLAIGPHNIVAGDSIRIAPNSLTFTCDIDTHSSPKTYPRALGTGVNSTTSDPAYNKPVLVTGVGATTITVQVLDTIPSTSVGVHTFVSATTGAVVSGGNYEHTFVSAGSSGITRSVVTSGGDHSHSFHSATSGGLLKENTSIGISTGGITFTCNQDGNATNHAYPRESDPFNNKILGVTTSTADTFTVNVGVTSNIGYTPTNATYDPETGDLVLTVGEHNLRPSTNHTATGADYNPVVGIMTVTVADHGFAVGDRVKFAENSLTFSCTAGAGNHSYPRPSDYPFNKWLNVDAVTSNTFNVKVLDVVPSTSTGIHTFISATANGVIKAGESVKLKNESLTFTCAMDGHGSEKKYPQAGYAHSYVTSASNAIIQGGNYDHTFVSATAGAAFTGGNYAHNFVSALPNALEFGGDFAHTFVSASAGAAFTGGHYAHTFVPGSENTNAVHVDAWSGTKISPTGATYAPDTGNLVLTFGSAHGLIAGSNTVGIATGSLIFTCVRDNNATEHAYPRSQDPIHGLSNVAIAATTVNTLTVNVGVSTIVNSTVNSATYTPSTGDLVLNLGTGHGLLSQVTASPTAADYNPVVGLMTVTVASHGFAIGEYVKFAENAFTFTCSEDTHQTNHSYPRPSDPYFNTWLPILETTSNSFTVKVLEVTPSTNVGVHTFVSALSNGVKKAQDTVGILTGGLTFSCARDAHATNHAYPRANDPYNNKQIGIAATSDNTVTVNVGISTIVNANINGIDYNASTGNMVMTVDAATVPLALANYSNVGIITGGITLTCDRDDHATEHAYPRTTDPVHKKVVSIAATTSNSLTVNVGVSTIVNTAISTATYNAAAGTLEMTVGAGHPFYAQSQHTVTAADYNPIVGVMTVTVAGHGFHTGDYVKFDEKSISFKCAQDGNNSVHAYPRRTDPSYNTWLSITKVDNNKFSVNVLRGITASNTTAHTWESAVSNGLKRAGSVIGIATNSITMTCARDAHATEHSYPRLSDPIHKKQVGIAATSATTITIDVGISTLTYTDVNTATYDGSSGELTLDVGLGHTFRTGSLIGIATNGLTFTCALDNHGSNHTYPRTTDPAHNTMLSVGSTSSNSITVNVGESGLDDPFANEPIPVVYAGSQHTVTGVLYNAVVGIMTVTVAGHGFSNGDQVKFADNSITLSCGMDGNTSNKTYPRATDPFHNSWMSVSGVTTNTFELQVGKSPVTGYGVSYASYNASTGVLELTVGDHDFKVGQSVRIANNSLTFTCAQDTHQTEHTYPRKSGQGGASANDPAWNTAVDVIGVGASTVTVSIANTANTYTGIHTFVRATDKFTPTAADYNPVVGIMTVTVAGHGFLVGERIKIDDNALTFTCAKDTHTTHHSYPRPYDPMSGRWVSIASTTLNTFSIQVLDSIPSTNTGVHTFVSAVSNSIVRSVVTAGGDYGHTFVSASNKGLTKHDGTVTINVGITTTVTYDVSDSTYDPATGLLVLTIGAHTLERGETVKIAPESLIFTCAKDGNATKHRYPQGGDPYFNGTPVTKVISNTQIEVNVGISTVPTFYNTGGKVQGAILVPREFNLSESGQDLASGGTEVKEVNSATSFTINAGISTTPHNYARSGIAQKGIKFPVSHLEGANLSSNQIGDGFYVLEAMDSANFRVQAGILPEKYYHHRGGSIEKPIELEIVEPDSYYNQKLEYISGATGIGTRAKTSFSIDSDGHIGQFDVIEEGVAYKIDDKLTVSGITTDPRVGILTEFQLTVEEIANDKFFGYYPGQFILFDDISAYFNGNRKKFTLSVTTGGKTDILSLKTIPGTDMDVTNNIFIYINDIIQTPGESYVFKGSRIIFSEAPKAESKCSVFYYRGSSLDVEEIEPIPTIKPGDTVQIKENRIDDLDRDQFERVTKRIVASDMMETFTYDSVGIDTRQDRERPIDWEKQRRDRILSGVLYPKARPIYNSKISPVTHLIKNLGATDNEIWVKNAFPLFSDLDLLTEAERDVRIFENRVIEPGIVTSYVSTSSSISSLGITSGGRGYLNITSPTVSISAAKITKKDPLSDWKFNVITGIDANVDLRAISKIKPVVAVGSSSQYVNTQSGQFWERGSIGFGGTIVFNAVEIAVGVGSTSVVAVGDYGKAARTVSYGDTLGSWTPLTLIEQRQIPAIGLSVDYPSTFERSFNDVTYDGATDTWVAVGFGGTIFNGVGIGTTTLYSQFSSTIQTLNSVVYAQNEYIAVGNGGAIVASTVGQIWGPKTSNTAQNLRDIIYDGSKFIAVGDNGTILTSTDKNYWNPFSSNLPAGTTNPATFDFTKIKFENGIYVGIATGGSIYYSLDLANWNVRSTGQSNPINDMVFVDSFGLEGRFILVGGGATAFYAEPIFNRATATASVTAGVVTSVSITDGGFGYEINSSPPVIVQGDTTKEETVLSFKSEGDFGRIVGINTFIVGLGFTVPPKIEFVLKSEFNDNTNLGYGFSSLNTFGINNSQLKIGDYFVIYDSPVLVGHALTGISTHVGGYNNYPANKVGIVTAGPIDGLYRVDFVSTADTQSGLVTVSCSFQPGPNSNSQIQVGIGTTAIKNYYGKYSWGRIYDYQNRTAGLPQDFFVDVDNGLAGIETAAQLSRTKPLT